MSRWEWFQVAWPAFWCGAVVGAGAVLLMDDPEPLNAQFSRAAFIATVIAFLPGSIAQIVNAVRRHRTAARRRTVSSSA